MNNLRKFQSRDEHDGTYGVIFHYDERRLIFAHPTTYSSQKEANDVADNYEKNPPNTNNWILVGKD